MKEKKLLKMAEFADSPEITLMESVLDLEDKIEESQQVLIDNLSQATQMICESRPEQIDNSEKLDEILNKLNEEVTVTLNII